MPCPLQNDLASGARGPHEPYLSGQDEEHSARSRSRTKEQLARPVFFDAHSCTSRLRQCSKERQRPLDCFPVNLYALTFHMILIISPFLPHTLYMIKRAA